MKILLATLTLTIFTLLGQSAWAAPEVHFLWSQDSARVLEGHAAVVATPVEQPLNAVHWKWDMVEAQQAISEVFPRERSVISPVQVVRSQGREEAELSEVDLRQELLDSATPLLSDR